MTFLLGFFLTYVALLWLSHVVSALARYNWRWNASSWYSRGLLSEDGNGVIVRGSFGRYLRDRGWGSRERAVVFRNDYCAFCAVDLLCLRTVPDAPYPTVTYLNVRSS